VHAQGSGRRISAGFGDDALDREPRGLAGLVTSVLQLVDVAPGVASDQVGNSSLRDGERRCAQQGIDGLLDHAHTALNTGRR
jgi:hypothetical protein